MKVKHNQYVPVVNHHPVEVGLVAPFHIEKPLANWAYCILQQQIGVKESGDQ